MKKIILFVLLCSIGKVYAQRAANNYYTPPPANNNSRVNAESYPNNNRVIAEPYNGQQVHLSDSTQEITADILPYKSEPKVKNDRYYFWHLNKVIHSTQGGYSGQLLNGHYLALYPDKNLKEEGNFKTGLKDGTWKTWTRKGDLVSVTNWNEGIEVADSDQPFWKKVPFINKKDAQTPVSKPVGN